MVRYESPRLRYGGPKVRTPGDSSVEAARIFRRRTRGRWREIAILSPSDGHPDFGSSVDIAGNQAIVGASADLGAAYIFRREKDDDSAVWRELVILTRSPSDWTVARRTRPSYLGPDRRTSDRTVELSHRRPIGPYETVSSDIRLDSASSARDEACSADSPRTRPPGRSRSSPRRVSLRDEYRTRHCPLRQAAAIDRS